MYALQKKKLFAVVMAVEEEICIEIPDKEADKMITVEDAVNFVAASPQAK